MAAAYPGTATPRWNAARIVTGDSMIPIKGRQFLNKSAKSIVA
jgi:hypothetical protein